ncbi:uncharacterized protein [Antedon mediterranea]|uniref:uncharacterized protein n=1 Tax=Antedon mediterranea TaxID=105859 RepID=UPI003AF9E465
MASSCISKIFYLITLMITSEATNTEMIGCYDIPLDPTDRPLILNPGIYSPDTVTVAECMTICRNLLSQYTLMTNSSTCLCGYHDLPFRSDNCYDTCTGTCSEYEHCSVYETTAKLGNIGIYHRSYGMALEQLSYDLSQYHDDQVAVPILEQITFAVNFTGTENITMSLDFTDNYPMVNIPLQSPNDIEHHFIQPLVYPISGEAEDATTSEIVELNTIVNSMMPVSNISLVCPEIVAATSYFECNVSVVFGSSLVVYAEYEVGNLTMDITDAGHRVYGVTAWDEEDNQTETDNIYYIGQVRSDGILVSWEFDVATVGTFMLQVYRPSPFVSLKNCTVNGTYNFRTGYCSIGMAFWPESMSTDLIQESVYTADDVGKQWYILTNQSSHIRVSKGDIFAFSSSDGRLKRTSNADNQEFVGSSGVTPILDVYNTLIQATVVTPSRAKVRMKVPDPIDSNSDDTNRMIFVEVSNELNFVSTSAMVHIQSYINGVEIVGPTHMETNATVMLTIPEHNGTDVVYQFDFANGDNVLTTKSSTVNYTWGYSGIYPVTVKAFNNISEDVYTFIIQIEDPVSELSYWIPASPSPRQPHRDVDVSNVTEAATMRWNTLSGTYYSIDVEIGTTEKRTLSASPRNLTWEDEITVDGVTLTNALIINEGACLTPLELETSNGTVISPSKAGSVCNQCSAELSMTVELTRVSTILGVITTDYENMVAEIFQVAYSNDNNHFINVGEFETEDYTNRLTTVFKNAIIARYIKVTIEDCSAGCGITLQVLGCGLSPVCRDSLELADESTTLACATTDCHVHLNNLHTVTGVHVESSGTLPSFELQYSLDDTTYIDLIDRSGQIVIFSSSTSSPVTHLFPEGVIAQYFKIILVEINGGMNIDMLGCKGSRICNSAFGIESGSVTADQITHSTSLSGSFLKLNDNHFENSDSDHWVSVDLHKPQTITGVVTQGCGLSDGGTFTVTYRGNDDEWLSILTKVGDNKVFDLNDSEATELTAFEYPIIARHFKMIVSSSRCFHFEPVGCYSPLICQTSLANKSTYKTNSDVVLSTETCWQVGAVEWIDIDVGMLRYISGILTKNITSFQVQYSQMEHNWISVVDDLGNVKNFTASDTSTTTLHTLFTSIDLVKVIYARHFRITFLSDGEFCLELIGCEGDGMLLFTSDTDANIPVNVTIHNAISSVSFYSDAFIQTPIANFQVHQTPILDFDFGYSVNLSSAYGSNLRLNATFNETSIEEELLEFDDVNNLGHCVLDNEIFPTPGNFVMAVTAENEVSGPRTDSIVIHIQLAIVGLIMKPNKDYYSTNETMFVNYTMTNGTELLILFEYGDGSSYEVYHDNLYDNLQLANHSYKQPGVYTIAIYARNNISSDAVFYTVVVQNPNSLGEIQLTPNSPGRIDSVGSGNGTLYTQYDFLGDEHDFPTNSTALYFITGMEYKEQNYSLVFDMNTKRTYHELYMNTYGPYTINITIFNHISRIEYSIDIEMEQPVENLAIYTLGKYQRVDENVTFLVNTTWGSRTTYVVSFGDSATYMISNRTSFYVSHPYNDSGVYHVDVLASNLICNVSVSMATNQFIQYPVEGVLLHSQEINLLPFDAGVSGQVSVPFFVFQNQSIHLPTNVTFIAYFNTSFDLPESEEMLLTQDNCSLLTVFEQDGCELIMCFNQTYTVEGNYNVCMKMWNEVSNGTACQELIVHEQLTQVKAHVYYIDVHENRTETEEPAFEYEGKIYVPLDRVILVKISYWNGTGLTYNWDFNDTEYDSRQVTDIPQASWNYTFPQIYVITVNSSNPVFFNVTSVEIKVEGAMRDLTIEGPGPIDISEEVEFNLTASIFGTGVCYRFEYINLEYLNSSIFFTGDLTICNTEYNTTDKQTDNKNDYDLLWKESFYDKSPILDVKVKFNTTCIYNVTIIAFNIVSREFKFTEQIITSKPCFYPEVSVGMLNLCNANYNCDDQGYRQFKSSEVITIFSEISISCQSTNKAYYNWTLSDENGVPYQLPDNVVTYGSPLPVLTIPRASFGTDYGTYGVSLTVTMDIECGLVTTDDTRITVTSSDLQARIAGGSFITVGNSSIVVMDAMEETIDPDSQSTDDLNISWFCRQYKFEYVNKTFKDIEQFAVGGEEAYVDEVFHNLTQEQNWNISMGCFHEFDEPAGELAQYRQMLKFEIPVGNFQKDINMQYEFMLLISHGNRNASATQIINVIQMDPPDVKLTCFANCEDRTNPSGRFTLKSFINSSFPVHNYRWEIINDTDEDSKLDYKDWEDHTSTGKWKANQVINEGFFKPNTAYWIKLFVNREDGVSPPAVAESRWEVSANDFPEVGNCTIEPAEGYAVETPFMIDCYNFTDVDVPLTYEFSVKSRNSTIWDMIYSGQERKLASPISLPQGDPPDYELDIRVSTFDVYKARSEDYNMIVKVEPLEQAIEDIYDIIEIELDKMRQLVGGGNIVAASTKAISISKLLNEISQNSTYNSTTDDSDKVYNATEETIRTDTRINVRMKIVEYSNVLKPKDLGDVKMIASAINTVLAIPDEISTETKEKALDVINILVNILSVQANESDTSANVLEGASSAVMECLGTFQLPPTSDRENIIPTEEQTLEYNNQTKMALDKMLSIVTSKMVIGQGSVEVKSTNVQTSVKRSSPDSLTTNETFGSETGMGVVLPEMSSHLANSSSSDSATVDMQMIAETNNPNKVDNTSKQISGGAVSMELKDSNGSIISVKNLTEPIVIFITRETIEPAEGENMTNDEVKKYGNTSAPGIDMTYLAFQDIERHRSLTVNIKSLGQKNMVIGESYNYTIFLYLRANQVPKEDYGQYDDLCVLSGQRVYPKERYYASEDEAYPRPWNDTHDFLVDVEGDTQCFYSNTFLNSFSNGTTTTFYIGIRHKMGLNKTVNGTSEDGFQQMRFQATYFNSVCMYLDETTNSWENEGLEVGPQSTRTRTQCFSNHLTSFGGGISVPINTVDLSSSPFASLNENPVVFVFMVCCMMLYLTVILWARKADQRDRVMAGVTPLKDNDPRDKIKYEITVFTGVKKRAGTSATVSFMIAGEEGETGIRVFQDEKRKIFERGNIDSFVLTTKRSLGQLVHIRIWHNNKGKHPSWFLSRISIKDLQTNRVFYFMLEKWLAVEEDDGQVERIIPVAGRSELTSFGHLFHSKTRRNLQDSHLWFSVFFRPSKSNFTRVQRATCCLSLLFSTMMANIIFYGVDMVAAGGPEIKFGPIQVSLTQVITGVMSSLMVFPTSLFTVQLFRTSEPKPEGARFLCPAKKKKIQKSEPCVKSISLKTDKTTETDLFMHDLMTVRDEMDTPASGLNRPQSSHSTTSNNSVRIEMKSSLEKKREELKEHLVLGYKVKRKRKKKRYLLNWRFKYLAWFIAIGNIGVAFWLTILYAAAFGKKKAEEWLTSIGIALIQDVLITQPIKVILIAVFFSLVIKNPIKEDDDSPTPEDGDELLHERMTQEELENAAMLEQFERERADTIAGSMPPDDDEILEARETRFKEIRMHKIVREIIIYILFLYVVMFVAYGNTDYKAFNLRQSIVDTYINAAYNGKLKFNKALKREQFWNWTDNVLIPSLFPDDSSSSIDDPLKLVADQQSYLIGVPVFRQVRIQKDKCEVPDVMQAQFKQDCRVEYSYGDEEVDNFLEKWTPITNVSYLPNYEENSWIGCWKYHSWYDLKKLPFWGNVALYNGGGYLAQLGSSSAESLSMTTYLKETDWLDQYTRAIFIDFVIYNPVMDFYVVSYLMVDFLPQGGMLGYVDFKVTKLKTINNLTFSEYALLGLEGIFLLFVLWFTYTEVKKILQLRKKYFKDKENIVELITLSIAVTAVFMYFYRLFESMKLVSERKESPTKLLNFQYVVHWETYFKWMMGFVLFIFTIKFMKLLRFNYRLRLFCETVIACWYEVLLFLIMFGVIFMGYTCCGFLLFSNSLYDYVTVVTTMESLFSFLLGKFDFSSLVGVSRILGPIYFFSFATISIFILMNMFLTVIIEAFCVVKHSSSENIQNDLEIVDFMIHRFKRWTGFAEKRLKKPVKTVPYIDGIDPVQVDCDELKEKLTSMVDNLNLFIRKERLEHLGPDYGQSDERIIFTA